MKNYFLPLTKFALVSVYLVIVAGAFVRMTGSGMGCPDWPKCFGYYIPPTQESELQFEAKKAYKKGMIIIKDEGLFVAKSNFISSLEISNSDWEKYTKHDYTIFNPYHTWVEYINRLLGALAGLACFISFILAFWHFKTNKKLALYAFIICILMGFQAWLGKTVVDSVLMPGKITTHMLVAFLIVAFQLYLIFYFKNQTRNKFVYNKKFNIVIIFALGLTLIQVVLGTNVREFIDQISDNVIPKQLWLASPTLYFYFHRSLSVLVMLTTTFLVFQNRKYRLGFSKTNWVLAIVLVEILSGILMYYFHFPFGTQTLHLILAALLFGFQFYLILETRITKMK
jgi:cytochrome c oxidase assembly protein subunit 15